MLGSASLSDYFCNYHPHIIFSLQIQILLSSSGSEIILQILADVFAAWISKNTGVSTQKIYIKNRGKCWMEPTKAATVNLQIRIFFLQLHLEVKIRNNSCWKMQPEHFGHFRMCYFLFRPPGGIALNLKIHFNFFQKALPPIHTIQIILFK